MLSAISTACLYPLETEHALKELLNLGCRRFEIFANCHSELQPAFISLLRGMLQSSGAKAGSLHLFTGNFEPFMLFSNYQRRFDEGLAIFSKYAEAAAALGAEVLVFHGDRKDSSLPIEEYCERFALLSAAAKEQGVTLAQENVARCKSGRVQSVKTMKRLLKDNIHFVLDVKQALRAGEDPFEMADAMAGSIVGVHLSDHDASRDCLLPGQGQMQFTTLRKKLEACGYTGAYIIEVYRHNFNDLPELKRSYDLLQGL